MKPMVNHNISYNRRFALGQCLQYEKTRIDEGVEELRGEMEMQIRSVLVSGV
jgi:hypothetical protein